MKWLFDFWFLIVKKKRRKNNWKSYRYIGEAAYIFVMFI